MDNIKLTKTHVKKTHSFAQHETHQVMIHTPKHKVHTHSFTLVKNEVHNPNKSQLPEEPLEG